MVTATVGSLAPASVCATLSISLIVVAILAPILGTMSDLKRGKKKMLAAAVLVGAVVENDEKVRSFHHFSFIFDRFSSNSRVFTVFRGSSSHRIG